MKFQPSFRSKLPKDTLRQRLSPEPFLSYNHPDKLLPPPTLLAKARFQHLYVPGGTGKGKSTQLLNIAVADIYGSRGISVIDPKGDLVARLLRYIPESRKDDVIYLDTETPIPFDFLAYEGATEKDELVEDIVFLLLGDAGNAPRARSILTSVLYTLFDSKEPISFLDIAQFLTNPDRRTKILETVQDKELLDYWKPGIPRDDKLEPILSRFTKYLRNSVLRAVFGTPNAPLKLAKVMNDRQILLVNLGGASRASLDYGSLVFMKMKQEIFRRHRILIEEQRVPHFLFVDEFQKFAHVEGFKDVLEMARSYKIGVTLANLSYTSLPEDIKNGIEIIQNFICFSLSPRDLSFFKYKCDASSDPQKLTDLPDYVAFYKYGAAPGVLTMSMPAPLLPKHDFSQYIKRHTLDTYAGNLQKRTGDKPPCNTSETPHDEGNAKKDDEITPSGPATI